ncbi:hypothetical protein A3H89_03265 [Candidatus Amesbacteria bacterium RIFCSPLOWO2_02_FULL_48_11]|nr:MAG: hypothetical protein A3C34_00595 [Candidatus Amesbacteria bacterium RIFCSPHIGHO2_02_FULL_48_21]OGD00439.1 MAG: hypothetical protein A2702_03675 [Candidatus Amesbacteria bacterium RIFCSPHIGHO2_01_FULL_48_75]OGD04780.1 MAG: hypothetical protein A3B58_00245 [Candidatus Amesbacteria bacterium RIFCSPLOWO2_01_FULL_48_50]OGD07691.1 MAG: hypothetical protein A3H89_03265 [Candidatus Amesbacteria bacterium RIFCSPLOWO2_02_FULL_48_11]
MKAEIKPAEWIIGGCAGVFLVLGTLGSIKGEAAMFFIPLGIVLGFLAVANYQWRREAEKKVE